MSIRKGRLTSQGLLATPVNFPIATVHAFAGTTAPEGWAMCDGSEVSKTQYAALYAVIGDIYGTPVDSNNFVLPDLRGEFLRGLDDMGTAAGARGKDVDGTARTVGQAQAEGMKSHDHQSIGNLGSRTRVQGYASAVSGALSVANVITSASGTVIRTNFTGGTETRPANMAINYIIKL